MVINDNTFKFKISRLGGYNIGIRTQSYKINFVKNNFIVLSHWNLMHKCCSCKYNLINFFLISKKIFVTSDGPRYSFSSSQRTSETRTRLI